MWWELILNSLLLGVGLAMDACAVSMANGLNEPKMRVRKILGIAFTFGFFQALMPLIGWVCVHYIAQQFAVVTKAIPYIALALLGFIGGKMIYEGAKNSPKKKDKQAAEETTADKEMPVAEEAPEQQEVQNDKAEMVKRLTFWALIVQALATSIDALSVGFTIAEYNVWQAVISASIIAVVTFGICVAAVFVGKKFGTSLGNKAEIIGGVILIAIGLEIFIKGVFFA